MKSQRKVIRKVNKQWRVSLPRQYMLTKGICAESNVEIMVVPEGILLVPCKETCFICGCGEEDNLKEIENLKICTSCIKNIKELEVE